MKAHVAERYLKKTVKVFIVTLGALFGIFLLILISRGMLGQKSSPQPLYGGVKNASDVADSKVLYGSGITAKSAMATPMIGQSRSEVITSEPPAMEALLPASDSRIIKNGNLSVKVHGVDQASEEISHIAKQNGGQVLSSNINQTTRNMKSGYITVKVPVVAFEKTFSDLKGIASFVVSESVFGQDVTEQYTDLQAQLGNKQSEEQAFQKILDQNPAKIDDILAITREISRVRGEVELLQGRIKFMDSQTDFSTITVAITEEITVGGDAVSWRPWQIIKDELNNFFKDMQVFGGFAIYLIVRVIPMLLVITLFVFIFWKVGKKAYENFFRK